METQRDILELTPRSENGERVYRVDWDAPARRPDRPSRLRLWLTTAAVGALAVAFALSVLTIFVYVVVPLFLILAGIGLLRRLRH